MLSLATAPVFASLIRGFRTSMLAALSESLRVSISCACLFACLIGLTRVSIAQAGANDPTFNVVDEGTFGDGADGPVYAIASAPDGRLLIGGAFTHFNGVSSNRIARLHPDGGIDSSFDAGSGANGKVWSVALQPDGKALIAGEFTSFDGVARNRVARVNANGQLDTSFDPGAGVNGSVFAAALASDGKLLIAGQFTTCSGAPRQFVARLNADGSLDTSFDTASGANGVVHSLALQPDGRVLIGGNFTFFDSTPRARIARLNLDGSLDTSFDPGAGASDFVAALALQPDGRVLLGGLFTSFDGVARIRTTRLHPDGSLDASYSPGVGANSTVFALALQPDGKLIVGGDFTQCGGVARKGIARLHSDGALDSSFDPGAGVAGGFVAATSAHALVLRADGDVVIGGDFEFYDGAPRRGLARIDALGALDSEFNPGAGASDGVHAVAVQPDGRILIGGGFLAYNGAVRNRIARLNADGSLDASFDPGAGADGSVRTLAVASDGRVLIGGSFSFYDGVQRKRVARLNADGSLDASFDPGSGANGSVWSIAARPDGKLLVGGDFGQFDQVLRANIALLNADGGVELNFNANGADGLVRSIALQPDGRALIAGAFTSYQGAPRHRIARVNANGSLALAFDPGAGADGAVLAVALQPDGKPLIGGNFEAYDGVVRTSLARLNGNGALDTSFDPGVGPDGAVAAIAIQPDGRVLIAGSFSTYNGEARPSIARLNADGSLDPSFVPGGGANGAVSALALQADGKLLLGGEFTSYDDAPRHRVARVFTVAPGIAVNYCTAGTSAIGCNPTMSASGVASASAASGWVVTTSNVEGLRQTNTFYSALGPRTPATPFGAGLLCVRTPTQRIGSVQASGSPGQCDGSVSIDVLAWAQAHPGAQGAPFTFGTTLNFQCAIRDPLSPGTRVMSDALQVTFTP